MRSLDWPEDDDPTPADCAAALGGARRTGRGCAPRGAASWGTRMRDVAARRLNLRVRMLGGSAVGYARMTRRWWRPVRATLQEHRLEERPIYFVSSNAHSIVNLLTGTAREREQEITEWVGAPTTPTSSPSSTASAPARPRGRGRTSSTSPRASTSRAARGLRHLRAALAEERAVGVTHLSSRTALRVSAQVIQVDRLDPRGARPAARRRPTRARLAACPAVIVNVEYPLGLAAYNILREITEDTDRLRGVYVLGKAATLNADVGDVMISSVIHDEHSGSTYWLDNAFSVDDIAPFLVFGSGLDNQRAVTVKSTFLQNRAYLDYYYREAFTVVEMEAGPFCDAVYEIADVDRYPVGEAVNFSKLPIDFGIIHYASDTPYTQARTLGARGLSYYGMDSTYASSLAIVRRVLALEGVLDAP